MKQYKIYFLAFTSCILLTACPSNTDTDEDNYEMTPESPSASEYSETINIPAEGCDKTISLDKLSVEITSVSSTPSWLNIVIQPYTSGSPSIKLTVGENLGEERRHTVAINTSNIGEKMNLNIVQTAANISPDKSGSDSIPGIEDYNDKTSNKPAYAPRR